MNRLQSPSSPHPVARVVATLLAAVALVASLLVGAVVFLVVLGVVAVLMLVFAVRFWRFRKQFQAAVAEARAQMDAAQAAGSEAFRRPTQAPSEKAAGTVIDGEYRREDD